MFSKDFFHKVVITRGRAVKGELLTMQKKIKTIVFRRSKKKSHATKIQHNFWS